jgi:large subunit ribosomal protein L21
VFEEVKGNKVSILRFRRRKNSMRKIGHRQRYTQIKIKEIKVGK